MTRSKLKFWNGHPKVNEEVTARLAEAESYRKHLESQNCPKCNTRQLHGLSIERGAKGWELKFLCDGCHSNGILNNTGLHVELTEAKK